MGFQVCTGAMMQCSFGVAPSALNVLPSNCVLTGTPAALRELVEPRGVEVIEVRPGEPAS